MTSRERVRAAVMHQQPDRIPIDFGGMRSTGIMAVAYHRLKEHLGISGGETFVYDVTQNLAQPEPELQSRSSSATRYLAKAAAMCSIRSTTS